jgi:hypothetical protein
MQTTTYLRVLPLNLLLSSPQEFCGSSCTVYAADNICTPAQTFCGITSHQFIF